MATARVRVGDLRSGERFGRPAVARRCGVGRPAHSAELETLLLRIVSPSGNKVGGKFVRSQNLAVQLRRDIRTWYREQERFLVPIRRKPVAEKKVRVEIERDGVAPPLAQFVSAPKRLRARYKGKIYRARIRRDGTILYDGTVYKTPSAAGFAVRKRSTNGWQFWQYERAPGDWVPLGKIRS